MSETIVYKSDSCIQFYSWNCASTNTHDFDINIECINPVQGRPVQLYIPICKIKTTTICLTIILLFFIVNKTTLHF